MTLRSNQTPAFMPTPTPYVVTDVSTDEDIVQGVLRIGIQVPVVAAVLPQYTVPEELRVPSGDEEVELLWKLEH